jgi:aspartyl/glutamyl-tRNA(Asn/Gln) amidotransferase C subunit
MTDSTKQEQITREDIRLTAKLSQLPLEEEEIPRIAQAMSTILEHFSAFPAIPVETAELHSPVERCCSLGECREDQPALGTRERIAEIAPDFEDEFFFVPRIK